MASGQYISAKRAASRRPSEPLSRRQTSSTLVNRRLEEAHFLASYLFPGPTGGSAYHHIDTTLKKAVEAAELPFGGNSSGVSFHTFRHTMTSLALNAGVPEPVVQRMGNWKDRRTVSRYAHLSDEVLRGGAAALDALIDGKSCHVGVTPRDPASDSPDRKQEA